jgi:hypothetical protein
MPKLMVITCANHVTWCSVVERARFSKSSSDTGKLRGYQLFVAIYYFLHSAKLTLKIFTFFPCSVGMMVLLGEMLVKRI